MYSQNSREDERRRLGQWAGPTVSYQPERIFGCCCLQDPWQVLVPDGAQIARHIVASRGSGEASVWHSPASRIRGGSDCHYGL